METAERGDLPLEKTAPQQKPPHRWQPGQSGNPAGRPRGARSRLTEDFLRTMADDFKQHGASVIETVRKKKPHLYLKAIVDLMPREAKLEIEHSIDNLQTADEILDLIADEIGAEAAAVLAGALMQQEAGERARDVTPEPVVIEHVDEAAASLLALGIADTMPTRNRRGG